MDQRRFFVFFMLSMLIYFGWIGFIVPALFPPPPLPPKSAVVEPDEVVADALRPENRRGGEVQAAEVSANPNHKASPESPLLLVLSCIKRPW